MGLEVRGGAGQARGGARQRLEARGGGGQRLEARGGGGARG